MKAAYQDGGMFFDEETDSVIDDYSYLVKHDYDVEGASMARSKFQLDHSEYYLN